MAEKTYPDPRVTRFINEVAVPVQFNVKEDPGAHLRYHAFWTPCLMLQDVDGSEHRRSIGPLDPEQFLAEFALAHGLRFLNTGNFGRAVEVLEGALEHTSRISMRHAENLYFLAAAKFELSGNLQDLLGTWEMLRSEHPDTEWAVKTHQLVLD